MHRVPGPLKVVDQPLYALRREGIKGKGREPTILRDFLVHSYTFHTKLTRSVQAGAQNALSHRSSQGIGRIDDTG
jgi:hypothetical protein